MINKDEAIELMDSAVKPALDHCIEKVISNAKAGSGFVRVPFNGLSKVNTLNHKFIMWKLSMLGFNVTLHDDLSAITISWF